MTIWPEIDNRPSTSGWTEAAIAVRSIMQIEAPLLLSLQPDGFEPIYVDFRHHAFDWSRPLADFPTTATIVQVETEPVPVNAPPLFELPAQNLDNLLWTIGLNAFDGAPASWLAPGDRYRLRRWPNFTEMDHTVEHLQLTAMLGQAHLSIEELASASQAHYVSATRIINAFSLMNILQIIDAPATPPAPREPAAETKVTGLFGRLRKRLGL